MIHRITNPVDSGISADVRRRENSLGAVILAVSTLMCGCQLHNVASFADQQAALLEIVPLGTPREDVAQKLKEAGVNYEASSPPNPGVFWCDSWTMPGGETFHMFSELRFDSEGRLQEVREYPNEFHN